MKKMWKRIVSITVAAAAACTMAAAPVSAAWMQAGSLWWYQNADGSYPKDGWQEINGKWYLFDQYGYMKTGWQQVDGKWYYLNPAGDMATGWKQIGKTWYYFSGAGIMQTGWLNLNGTYYYLQNWGGMATGTHMIDGKNYTFTANGVWNGASSQPSSKDLRSILNSATLKPQYTVSDTLNQLIQDFISKNLNDSMDTYTKVKTVFDYMLNHYTYSAAILDLGSSEEVLQLYLSGGMNEIMAMEILQSGSGVCDNYSAAFAAIMRAIGLNCKFVYGTAYTTSGSGSGHAWTVIDVGGTEYIFDPQIEQNIAERDGVVHYYRFGPTYASIPGRYDVAGSRDFLPVN